MIVSAIVAMTTNRVIGKENDLPWHLPKDFEYFKNKTINHHVVIGRKSWGSIPNKYRPLPNRINMVISRDQSYTILANTLLFNSVINAMEYAKKKNETELFIIGGGQIYEEALPFCKRLYLTQIHTFIKGNIFFPKISPDEWGLLERKENKKDKKHAYDFDFLTYERKIAVKNF